MRPDQTPATAATEAEAKADLAAMMPLYFFAHTGPQAQAFTQGLATCRLNVRRNLTLAPMTCGRSWRICACPPLSWPGERT